MFEWVVEKVFHFLANEKYIFNANKLNSFCKKISFWFLEKDEKKKNYEYRG